MSQPPGPMGVKISKPAIAAARAEGAGAAALAPKRLLSSVSHQRSVVAGLFGISTDSTDVSCTAVTRSGTGASGAPANNTVAPASAKPAVVTCGSRDLVFTANGSNRHGADVPTSSE